MQRNKNITPRALSYQEKADREKGIYDSFANYLCCCGKCNYLDKSNMYLMRAESRVKKLNAEGVKCPECGECAWILGYPLGSPTGFVRFD